MKKLLGGMKMGWGRVLAMAVISGALTGILNVIPALEGTSLTVFTYDIFHPLFRRFFRCLRHCPGDFFCPFSGPPK